MRLRLLAAALLALFSAAPAQEAEEFEGDVAGRIAVRPYAGRYRHHPLFRRIVETLEARIDESMLALSERLGPDCRLRYPPAVWLHDGSPRQPGCKRPKAFAEALHSKTTTLGFHVEHYVRGDADFDLELAHELVHAAMRQALGAAAYRKVPRWLREGLALYGAGQGEERLAHMLAGYGADEKGNLEPKEPSDVVAPLESGRHGMEDYATDALAIEFVEDSGGPGAVRRLYTELVRGVPYRRAIEEVTGLAWAEFRDEAHDFALVRARRELLAGRAAFGRALAAYNRARRVEPGQASERARRYGKAAGELERFLEDHGVSIYARPARLLLARALLRPGGAAEFDRARAREVLEELVAERGPYARQARRLLAAEQK